MSCCHPSPRATGSPSGPAAVGSSSGSVLVNGRSPGLHALAQVHLPSGSFEMGDHFAEGYPADGELPLHRVQISGFSMDATLVTNEQFACFTEATGYLTESERLGYSAVFRGYLSAPSSDVIGSATGTSWWLGVRGANWRHPTGRGSSWQDLADHPVVQVSWNDAMAYCRWAGRALPTEAQWEYAARGLVEGQRYAWGNELMPGGRHQCNIWQGNFPQRNSAEDGYTGTSPVKSYPPNPVGLFDVAGNAWEWCSDWFLPKYYRNSPLKDPTGPTIGDGRVLRGGSHLCHDSYCNRYRVSARSHNSPDSASSNTGFRTVNK
ncbi:formylglycine-generating enzyme family protein [Glutamicibacter creatinolyticus]|uniref:formylglycine-generating enzyme family protein n=1 Tax=Glutamicibacter creatinolyticus TaxID=162496 RepID=UPI0033E2DA23